jgi:HlyD family secretion protein
VKKSHKIIIIVVAALVVVSIIGVILKSKSGNSGHSKTVRIENAKRGELTEYVSAPGEIEPKTKVELSAKVSARIVELPFEEGDTVTGGDPKANPPVPPSVLVRLDAKDLESQLLSAEAGYAAQAAQLEVEKARVSSQESNLEGLAAKLNQARRDWERQKGLLESQDISQATFDQTQAVYDELKSQYDSAKYSIEAAKLNLIVLQHNLEAAGARVTQAKEALSYTTITSPIDGVVTRINAEVGEVVIFGTMNNPGTVIMEVADLSTMLVVAQVDESDVGKLEVGQKADVFVDAYPDDKFEGTVDSVALAHIMSNTGTKCYRTEILLKNTEKTLHSGLSAHVDIETRKHTDILKVPTQAVLGQEVENLPLEIRDSLSEEDKGKTYATVVYRYVDGKTVVTPVKIGQSDLTHTIIKSGITEEDRIVVGPFKELQNIGHGQRVQDEREAEAKKKGAKTEADANEPNEVKEDDSDK